MTNDLRGGRSFGLRLVAWYEGSKGILALAVGAGVLSLLHRDVASVVEQWAQHLHLNPAKNHPGIFVDALSGIHDPQLVAVAVGAAAYAVLRLVVARALWLGKLWAKWVTALSDGIYLPFEVYELSRGLTAIRLTTFVANILIILFMVNAIRRNEAAERAKRVMQSPLS